MNEVYIVLQLEGVEPVVCDLWSSLPEAQAEFDEIVKGDKLSPIVWDSEGIRHELTGTIAVAGDDACSAQILRRTVHGGNQ